MDLDQINLLTDEQKERYMDLSRLFEMPGWAIVKKWAELQSAELLTRGANAASWDENRISAGQRVVYDLVVKLPEITDTEYATLARQNAEVAGQPEYADAEFVDEFA